MKSYCWIAAAFHYQYKTNFQQKQLRPVLYSAPLHGIIFPVAQPHSNRTTMSPRFQLLRKSRLIRSLKWLLTRPFFWAAVAIIIALNWSYGQLVPHIVSVPIVRQGGDLNIDGQHFGAQ
jgi:hypothetical protein